MGAATTKAQIREAIARKQGDIAIMKQRIASAPTKAQKDAYRPILAGLQADLARLKADLKNAPK